MRSVDRNRLRKELAAQGHAEVEGASAVSPRKAKEMLHHGTVHGKAITPKQRRFFGFIAGGGHPRA